MTSTGQLYAFGANDFGQLGSATNNGTGNPNPTPTLVSLPGATGPVTAIAAGADHSLAVTSTGQLYAFGNNSYGQLGNATNNGNAKPNPTPTLVSLPGATGPVTADRRRRRPQPGGDLDRPAVRVRRQHYGQLGNATNNGHRAIRTRRRRW